MYNIKQVAQRTIKNHNALKGATGAGQKVCTAQIVADAVLLAEATLRHCAAAKRLMTLVPSDEGYKFRLAKAVVERDELRAQMSDAEYEIECLQADSK